jgi:Ca2+/Na+ antiporter
MDVIILVVSIVIVLITVQKGLCRGIDNLALALNWSPKTRGQVTGFATSIPEFAALISTALNGVWAAGLWNIASSNIINVVLLITAVCWYRQYRDLWNKHFIDEMLFAGMAVAFPLLLMYFSMDQSPYTVPILLFFYLVYRLSDRVFNRAHTEPDVEGEDAGSAKLGLLYIIGSIAIICVAGNFLGTSAEAIVNKMEIPVIFVGWLLGFVTSLPELTTFFKVYSAAKKKGALGGTDDTQEVLDNLTGSNMSNVGIIYPIALLIFLFVN